DDAAALFEEVAADDAAALLAASGGEWKLRQQQQLLTAAGVTVSVEPEPAADAQEWRAGELALAGQTRRFGEQVWRAVQAHLTQTGWEPPAVPALWTPVSDSGGAPAWTQPTGAHDAYALGALVTHGGAAWQSLVANNVWEPTAANATLWQRQS
ncbi:MAG: hypothetical protein LBD30_08145, partial [Verrucomicrobiales bacterium]|nr:hypothetical protein [Verrucomicrobiales bacterium]